MRNMKTVPYEDMFTLSAPSPKWVWNAQGQLVEVPAGQPAFGYDRFTGEPLGQIIESVDATNVLLNSFAPATQTVSVSDATTYTLSVYGSGSAEITAGGSGTATDGSPLTFTTTGTNVTVTVTGTLEVFQLEAGSVATSPIETAGSAVTRAADICYSAAPFADRYNPERGSMFFHYAAPRGVSRPYYILSANRSGSANAYDRIIIYSQYVRVHLLSSAPVISADGDFLGEHKVLLSWKSGVVTIFIDGDIAASATTQMPDSLDQLGFFRQIGYANGTGGGLKKQFWLSDQPVTEARGVELTTL